MEKLRVLYIFRKPLEGFYSIENLFSSIQKYLSENIEYEDFYLPYHQGWLAKIKNIFYVLTIRKFFSKFDIIHITGDITYITPFIKGRKVITFHDLGSLFSKKRFLENKILEFFWVRLPIFFAKKITVISPSTYDEILSIVNKAKTKLYYIPNCIADNLLDNKPCLRQKVLSVLAIGTKKNKNLERIIRSVSNLGITLVIVGYLNDEQFKILNNRKLEYIIWSSLKYNQIKDLYKKVDIVVFPSLYEGFGLPIIEAHALGIPLITSNIEPMSSIAGQGAIKVDPYSEDQLRFAIISLIKDFSLRQKLVKIGNENAKNYLCSNISQQYVELYYKLMKNK